MELLKGKLAIIKVWSLYRSASQQRGLLFTQAGKSLKARGVMFAQAVLYQTTLRIGEPTLITGHSPLLTVGALHPQAFSS